MIFGLVPRPGDDAKAEEPAWRPLPLIADGKLAEGGCHLGWGRMMESAEREAGPWFAVHQGYEVQMQNHDPGDVVWPKELSVHPLPESGAR